MGSGSVHDRHLERDSLQAAGCRSIDHRADEDLRVWSPGYDCAVVVLTVLTWREMEIVNNYQLEVLVVLVLALQL